jgi:hypothetical protein
LIARTFALHTAVIVLGVYSSGPPPIKNLYATAIVIGWGCVLFGSIFERTSERIGNMVAAVATFLRSVQRQTRSSLPERLVYIDSSPSVFSIAD